MGHIVVFDIEGVSNLPQFHNILRSLGDTPYVFWTALPTRERAKTELDNLGIHVHPEKIISRNEAERVQETLTQAARNGYDEQALGDDLRAITGLAYGPTEI